MQENNSEISIHGHWRVRPLWKIYGILGGWLRPGFRYCPCTAYLVALQFVYLWGRFHFTYPALPASFSVSGWIPRCYQSFGAVQEPILSQGKSKVDETCYWNGEGELGRCNWFSVSENGRWDDLMWWNRHSSSCYEFLSPLYCRFHSRRGYGLMEISICLYCFGLPETIYI